MLLADSKKGNITLFVDSEKAADIVGISLKQFRRAVKRAGLSPVCFSKGIHTKQLWVSADIQRNSDLLRAQTGQVGKKHQRHKPRLPGE